MVKLNKEKEKLKIWKIIAHLYHESFYTIYDSTNTVQNWRRSTVHKNSDSVLNNIQMAIKIERKSADRFLIDIVSLFIRVVLKISWLLSIFKNFCFWKFKKKTPNFWVILKFLNFWEILKFFNFWEILQFFDIFKFSLIVGNLLFLLPRCLCLRLHKLKTRKPHCYNHW